MFHVELRQFPNVARSFNLTSADLETRIVRPWVAERPVELDDRRFSPEKAKLTIYEAPLVRPEEMGLGRGWANVTRSGEDVTARVVEEARAARRPDEPASLERLKLELLARASRRALPIGDALTLAQAQYPDRRVSEQLALAEQAIWELLHQRYLRLLRDGRELDPTEWQPALLDWDTWRRSQVTLAAVVDS